MDRRELRFHAQEQNDTIQCKNITTPSNLDNLITNIFYFISKLLGDLSNLALTRFTRSKWPIYKVIYKKSSPGVPKLNSLVHDVTNIWRQNARWRTFVRLHGGSGGVTCHTTSLHASNTNHCHIPHSSLIAPVLFHQALLQVSSACVERVFHKLL